MKKIILLAIASGSFRDNIYSLLMQKNYELLIADDGQHAIDLIVDHKVDLIVSSLNLPIVDGLSLSTLIREHAQSRFIPILLLLNSSLELNERGLLASNISCVLKIPFNMDDLLFKIRKLLPS